MKALMNSFLVLVLISLIGCNKEDDNPSHIGEKYDITLTDDYQIIGVTHYINDNISGQLQFNYSDDLIIVTELDENNSIEQKSYYYFHDQLADSSVDSLYYTHGFPRTIHHRYTYDEQYYLIAELTTLDIYTSENGLSQYSQLSQYEYTDGNQTSVNENDHYTDRYEYNDLENKINIRTFLGNYCGQKNKSLLARYENGDHASSGTIPENDQYTYELNDHGLVKKKTRVHNPRTYPSSGNIPEKTTTIIEYEYFYE